MVSYSTLFTDTANVTKDLKNARKLHFAKLTMIVEMALASINIKKGSVIKFPHNLGIFVYKKPNNLEELDYFRKPLITAICKNFSGIVLHISEEVGRIF